MVAPEIKTLRRKYDALSPDPLETDQDRMPPTLQKLLMDALSKPSYTQNVPAVIDDTTESTIKRSDSGHESVIENSETQPQESWGDIIQSMAYKPGCSEPIPISTVGHENKQLVFSRPHIPVCMYDKECCALSLVNAPAPLCKYLSPDEQLEYEASQGQILPESAKTPGACLLCIRRDVEMLAMYFKTLPGNTLPSANKPQYFVPPFQNLVNTPSGYKQTYMGCTPECNLGMSVFVCGSVGFLPVRSDPAGYMYVDQQKLVYTGAPVSQPSSSTKGPSPFLR